MKRREFLRLAGATIFSVPLCKKIDAADIVWSAPNPIKITHVFIYNEQGMFFRVSKELMVMLRTDP